ncbi:MAG: hypothetical protein Q9212_004915 [Teloschistes hypoglaucus]
MYITYLFVKLSILLLYLRLFEVKRILRYLIWAGIALQVVGYAGVIGEKIAEYHICNLDFTSHSLCRNSYKVTNFQAVFSVLTDFYVLLLPIKVILGLQMSWKRKWGVLIIFVTGLLACTTSLIRTVLTIKSAHSTDMTWSAGYICIFTVVEINCGIIAGALNVFPAFIRKSGLSSLGRSAFSSIRSRPFGRPESSDFDNSPKSAIPIRKARNPRDGRYIELGALPVTTATVRAGGVSDRSDDWSFAEKTSRQGTPRRDDHEVSHSPSQVARSYESV